LGNTQSIGGVLVFAINTGLFRGDTFSTIHREATSVLFCWCSCCVNIVGSRKRHNVHKEVGSGMSGLKRSRARSIESQDSDEFFTGTSETLLAVTAPTICCWMVSVEGSIVCSADVRVNSPHGCPTWGDANTLKLTCGQCGGRRSALSGVVCWLKLT
jgi:hypothetical protein